jgi:hypothetical protein
MRFIPAFILHFYRWLLTFGARYAQWRHNHSLGVWFAYRYIPVHAEIVGRHNRALAKLDKQRSQYPAPGLKRYDSRYKYVTTMTDADVKVQDPNAEIEPRYGRATD